METIPWILIAVAILIILLAVIMITFKKQNNRPPDYYSFFWMGIIWIVFGLPSLLMGDGFTGLTSLFAMGVVFTAIGLVNKDKWKTNRICWKDLTDKEKKFKLFVITFLGALVLAGLIAFYIFKQINP